MAEPFRVGVTRDFLKPDGTLAHDDYRGGDALAMMRQANEELLLIAQIESVRGLGHVEQIAALEGLRRGLDGIRAHLAARDA